MPSYIIIPSLVCLRALHEVLALRVISSNESEKEILNDALGRLVICGALQKVPVTSFGAGVADTARGFAETMATAKSIGEWIATPQGKVFQCIMNEELQGLKKLLATQQGVEAQVFALDYPSHGYCIDRHQAEVESFEGTSGEHWSADDPEAKPMFPELSGLSRGSRTPSRMSGSLTRRSTGVSTSSGSTG
jgi:hypothetical protein